MNVVKEYLSAEFDTGDIVKHRELPALGFGIVAGRAGGKRTKSVEVIWQNGKQIAHLNGALVKTEEPNILMKSLL